MFLVFSSEPNADGVVPLTELFPADDDDDFFFFFFFIPFLPPLPLSGFSPALVIVIVAL